MTPQSTPIALADTKQNPDEPTQAITDHTAALRLAYTAKELSSLLGVSTRTLNRLEARGLLRSSNALRTRLFPLAEVERFLADTLG